MIKRSPVRVMSDSGFVFWRQIDGRKVELESCHTGAHMILDVITGNYDMVDGSIIHSVFA